MSAYSRFYELKAIVGSEQGSPLPVCDNLRRLVLSADHHELPEDYAIHDFEVYAGDEDPSVSPKTLLELLHSTPSLRTLVIDFVSSTTTFPFASLNVI